MAAPSSAPTAPELIQQLSSKDAALVDSAAERLYNCCLCDEAARRLVGSQRIPLLCDLLRSPEPGVQMYAGYVLSTLPGTNRDIDALLLEHKVAWERVERGVGSCFCGVHA